MKETGKQENKKMGEEIVEEGDNDEQLKENDTCTVSNPLKQHYFRTQL